MLSYRHYLLLVKIKDFNVLIDNKPIFDQPVKNKQEVYEKLVKLSRDEKTIRQKIN